MGTIRNWIGGGPNDLYAAADWSPVGVPQAGDTLYLVTGTASLTHGNLSGDTLMIGAQTSYTSPPPAIVDLSGGAKLSASVSEAPFTEQSVVFNVSGAATLHLSEQANYYATTMITENIGTKSTLTGNFVGTGHNVDLTINGADGTSRYSNTGASSVAEGVVTIHPQVIGIGSFTVGSSAGIVFLGGVGSGQTINAEGADTITIGAPGQFHGLVNFMGGAADTIDLAGLAHADSYSYASDMLDLFKGAQVVDKLRFSAGSNAFQVTENNGVQISSNFYSAGESAASGDGDSAAARVAVSRPVSVHGIAADDQVIRRKGTVDLLSAAEVTIRKLRRGRIPKTALRARRMAPSSR